LPCNLCHSDHREMLQIITKEVPVEVEKVEYREVQVPVERIVDKVTQHAALRDASVLSARLHVTSGVRR
jgi:hypothetical protein